MAVDEQIAKLQDLSRRLAALVSEPEPGLFTWSMMVGRVLAEIAAFAPADGATLSAREERLVREARELSKALGRLSKDGDNRAWPACWWYLDDALKAYEVGG